MEKNQGLNGEKRLKIKMHIVNNPRIVNLFVFILIYVYVFGLRFVWIWREGSCVVRNVTLKSLKQTLLATFLGDQSSGLASADYDSVLCRQNRQVFKNQSQATAIYSTHKLHGGCIGSLFQSHCDSDNYLW